MIISDDTLKNYHFSYFRLGLMEFIPKDSKISLAVFNFYGTLGWGVNGQMFNYDKVIPSSPNIEKKFEDIINKGYKLCIVECVAKNKLENFKNILEEYYTSFINKKICIDVFVIHNKKHYANLKSDLLKFFKPLNKSFGEKSFYCGDEIGPNHHNPFFRFSDNDLKISKQLGFNFVDPFEILGDYSLNKITVSD